MSKLNPNPDDVKLVVNFFYNQPEFLEEALDHLESKYGPQEYRSTELPFEHTTYYHEEMGTELKKMLVSFRNLVPRNGLVELKHEMSRLELEIATRHAHPDQRPINIDPGHLYPEKFILATGKNFPHRIYLDRGVYADLTLIFRHGRFEALPWTYTDYLEHDILILLDSARKRLIEQLHHLRKHGK